MIIAPTIIALREGIEIALVLTIMLLYLKKTNRPDLKRYVLGGTVLAIVASAVTASIMGLVWGIFEGPMLNMFEGSVVLIAAVLLTTMIIWMRTAGSQIATEIEDSMGAKNRRENGLGLALLAFSLVLREGVELVFFSTALAIQEGIATYAGVILGLSLATVIGMALYQGSLKISLKSFFNWTSVLLVLFAAGMIAYGIHELQEAGLLLIGPIEVWNINPPLLPDGSYPLLHDKGLIGGLAKALFGYNGNPSALEVIAYAAYLTLITVYFVRTSSAKSKSQSDQEEKQVQVQSA